MEDTKKAQKQLSQELAALHRQVTEMEPRDSEAQYRATLDAMSDILHVVDDELRIVFANDALRRGNERLGLETDVVGRTIYEVYPFLPPEVREEYDRVFESGQLLITEERTQVGDREIFTETRKIPVRERGKVTQVITVMRDITEHKRAESQRGATLEALYASERKFRGFVEQSADGIVLADEQGIIVEWNQAQERITGLKRIDMLGKPVWDVLHQVFPQEQQNAATRDRYMAETSEFLRTGQAAWLNQLTDREVERSDGTRRDVQAIMFPIKTNKGLMAASIIRDITERKRAEEEIRRQAETLFALHETALGLSAQGGWSDVVRAVVLRAMDLLKAREGSFFSYRPATDDLERTLDYSTDPESGLQWTVLRRGEGVAGKVLESGRPLAVDDYNRWEGRLRQYENDFAIIGVPVCWNNRPLGVLTIADDSPRTFSPADIALLESFAPLIAAAMENNRLLHDLQQQVDRMKEAQAQLVQAAKLAAVGELAAGVAHELNNPLTSILGFAELLLHDTPPDAPARHDLEIIVKQAGRARDIVRNLLGFARQTTPQRLPVSVNQILQQTMDLVRQLIEKSGIDVVEDYAPDIGLLTLDSGQMKQVFLNLITNASHAMPHGGTLSVRTARVGSEVAISVSDTGEGISPEIREHIFEPFFTTKPVGQGTGLGLSVSLGIVQAHAGRITVESRAGQGSTFTVWLPADSESQLDERV